MGWLIGPWLETLAWAEVRAVRSSRQRVGFYTRTGVALWVVHSEDGGQLISCHTCTHILDFCEIIFWFPSDSPCPAFSPDCLLGPKTQEKHVKISKIALQNQWECVTIPRGQTRVSFYFTHCLSPAAWQSWFISNLFWNDSGKGFIVFSKWNKPCQDDVKIINDIHKALLGSNICLTAVAATIM